MRDDGCCKARCPSRTRTAALCATLIVIWITFTPTAFAQLRDRGWTQPYRLSGEGEVGLEGVVAEDGEGRTHVVWAENFGGMPPQSSAIYYALFDGDAWSRKVEIRRTEAPVTIGFLSVTIDPQERLHLAWNEGDTQFIGFPSFGPVFHSWVPVNQALDASSWTVAREISIPARRLRIRADAEGSLHLLFSRWLPPDLGVYSIRSEDLGVTWSDPVYLDPDIPDGHRPDVIQLEIDGSGGLHSLWYYLDDANGNGDWIRYARSTDSGLTWSEPTTIDRVQSGSEELRLPFPGMAVSGQTVHVVWAGGGVINVGRRHRFSIDAGATWSPVNQIFGDLHGQANGDALEIDAEGRLQFMGQLRWPQGLYRAVWEAGQWSAPNLVYLIASDFQDPVGDRIHAHGVRLALPRLNQIAATFTTAPVIDPSVNLYSMHTRRPLLYFPHYGVGSGLSMLFAISNPSDVEVAGTLKTYDPAGAPQELLFDQGPAAEVRFELPPKASRFFTARGPAESVLSGYAKVETEQPGLIGLAIFRFATGLEASVPPIRPNRRFALFVEETAEVSTGIAALRLSPRPIRLVLYDSEGELVGSEELALTGNQRAVFLHQVFSLPEGFRGLLFAESDGDICPIGLRFGRGVLSTIEVIDVDDATASSYVLAHYADGQGLSMSFANSNPTDEPSSAIIRFFDSNGEPQELSFVDGTKRSSVSWDAAPRSTSVLDTTGQTEPVVSGYAQVDFEQAPAAGFGLFRFDSGREASVLPTVPGTRFALFVERDSRLDTGIALLKPGASELSMSLYTMEGELLERRSYQSDQVQEAQFLRQFFTIPEIFRGLLILESEEAFAVLGLRFGDKVVSTVPVRSLDPN